MAYHVLDPISMFNLGFPEILIIGSVVLLVFGPKRLPELAKGLGKGIRGFKKAIEGEFDDAAQSRSDDAPQRVEGEKTAALPMRTTVLLSKQESPTPTTT